MFNVETDLEQLELYLDRALDGAERTALQNRLNTDENLARLLAELKSQRALRSAVWQSMEGDAGAADRLQWRVRGAILHQTKQPAIPAAAARTAFWSSWRMASVGSAAAACLVLGFCFGRMGQNRVSQPLQPTARINTGQIENVAQVNRIPSTPDMPVPHDVVARTNPAASGGSDPREVLITDAYGRVVAHQRFATPEEASSFAKDLHGTHADTSSPVAGPSRLATQEQ